MPDSVDNRITALETRISCFANDLASAFDMIQEFVDEAGGCDHSVGICYCREYELLGQIKRDIAWVNENVKVNHDG